MTIIGVLLAIGIPRFMEYMKRSKVSEALSQLGAIELHNMREFHENTVFVSGTVGATPTMSCCTQNAGGQRKCPAVAADWTSSSVWSALEFSIDRPFYFQYAYTGAGGTTYTATATGDLDCDGDTATYTLNGYLSASTPASTLVRPTTKD